MRKHSIYLSSTRPVHAAKMSVPLLRPSNTTVFMNFASLALDTRPIFDHMVDNGVEIKKYGHVALFGAITEGKKDWVEFLISQGADPNLCLSTESDIGGGEKKYSSIYHAILNGHLDVCKFLIEHGVQPEEDDLQLAREKEYDEIVGILSGFSYVDVPEKEDLITRWINTHS
ncbi:hypothetical protein KXX49_006008 [Aspergillus fumigatus]|nr:hypothetical protein KXX49_006008 [Aspergillus fumigatus]